MHASKVAQGLHSQQPLLSVSSTVCWSEAAPVVDGTASTVMLCWLTLAINGTKARVADAAAVATMFPFTLIRCVEMSPCEPQVTSAKDGETAVAVTAVVRRTHCEVVSLLIVSLALRLITRVAPGAIVTRDAIACSPTMHNQSKWRKHDYGGLRPVGCSYVCVHLHSIARVGFRQTDMVASTWQRVVFPKVGRAPVAGLADIPVKRG